MRKQFVQLLIIMLCIFGISAGASATYWGTDVPLGDYSGIRDSGSGIGYYGGLTATGTWVNGGVTLDWEVSFDSTTNKYTYIYNIMTANGQGIGDLSHFTLEVTDNDNPFVYSTLATTGQVVEDPTYIYGTSSTWGEGVSFYGVKFDYSSDGDNNTYTIITDRAPVWGVAFLKDGSADAWTSALDHADFMTADLLETDFIARPDGSTSPVPEPATMLLLGSGLVGLAGLGRKKYIK